MYIYIYIHKLHLHTKCNSSPPQRVGRLSTVNFQTKNLEFWNLSQTNLSLI